MTTIATTRDTPVGMVTATVAYTSSLLGAYGETPANPWVEAPRIRCPHLTLKCGGVDEAQLFEKFSQLGYQQPEGGETSDALWTDLEGKFVRVTAPIDEDDGGPIVWYGYVPQGSRQRNPHYALDDEDDPVSLLSGVQQWRAVGLAWFLGRRQIDSAVVADVSPGADAFDTRRVLRPMTFNGGTDSGTIDRTRPRGNKSQYMLAFSAAEPGEPHPRAIAVAEASFGATSTIGLAEDPSNLGFALATVVLPEGWLTSVADVPLSITQYANRIRGVAGDTVRLKTEATGSTWFVDQSASTEWDAEAMVEYLLTHHGPVDADSDAAPCPFVPGDGGDALRTLRPTLPTEGRDVLSLLDTIASRSRGLTWRCETVTPDEDELLTAPEVRVHAYSLAAESITIPGAGSFPANAEQYGIDPDDDHFAGTTTVSINREQRYDRVRVRGARMTSTFTVAIDDRTLAPDWTGAAENAYHAGASGDAGYGDLDSDAQVRANDARRAELSNGAVYSAFRIPHTWDGKTADGDGASTRYDVFPEIGDDFTPIGPTNFYLPALRPLRHTRLESALTAEAGDGFESPFGVLLVDGGEEPDRWALAHALTDASASSEDRIASYRLVRGDAGISLRLYSSKGLPHSLAGAWAPGSTYETGVFYPAGWRIVHDYPTTDTFRRFRAKADIATSGAFSAGQWTDIGPYTEPAESRLAPEVDYRTLRVTLSAESDQYAEAVHGTTPAAGVSVEEIVINAGDTLRLDYLVGGTVLGVASGALVTAPAGRVLRDDRPSLEKIAAMAYAWYKTPTQSIRLAIRRPYYGVKLGDFITEIGRAGYADPVGTVVTEVSIGLGGEQTTTITTSGVEEAGIGAISGGTR